MSFATPILLIGLIALLCSAIYKYLLHPTYISPLSKIPNAHSTAPISSWWISQVKKRRIENRTLLSLHKKYGPVIRLAPHEISVSCIDGGVRTVYSGGNFEKHEWYSQMGKNYGIPNMFSMTHSKPHSVRKRMISNVYSKSFLQSSKDMHAISKALVLDRLLPILHSSTMNDTPVDVLELTYALAMDFITAYLFGLTNGTDFLRNVPYRKHWLKLYRSSNGTKPESDQIPTAFAAQEIEAWCLSLCHTAQTPPSCENGPGSINTTEAIVYNQLARSLCKSPDPSPHPKPLILASEMLDHILAGQETTGITLTYLTHELSRHPSLQSSLRSELRTLSPSLITTTDSPSDLPTPRTIDALSLLDALLLETLRLYAAAPGPQPRVTPSPSTTIAGFPDIPAGVKVSAAAHVLHRNEAVFPEAGTWKPERWMEGGRERREEMMRWFWAFGSGGRMCVGSHFAMQEMKLVVAAIYSNYRTIIVDDEGIQQADGYVAGPVGNQLALKFERL